MFKDEPLSRELAVRYLLLIRQRMMLALSSGQAAVGMQLRQPQVAAVRETLGLRQKRQTAFLEQLEVVLPAFAEASHQDALCLGVRSGLGFLRMPLLLFLQSRFQVLLRALLGKKTNQVIIQVSPNDHFTPRACLISFSFGDPFLRNRQDKAPFLFG